MVEQATIGAKAPARIKNLLVKELAGKWQQMQSFVVVCPIGLDAIVSNQLRESLTTKDIEMTVVKNSLARLALEELDLAPAAELLDAPSAICFGGESVVDVARELVDWSKKDKALKLRGAFVEGQIFSADQVRQLATMPNRSELLGQIVTLISSPAGNLVSAVQAVGAGLAGSVRALIERLTEQAPPAEAEEASPPAESSDAPAEESTQDTDSAESSADAQPEKAPESQTNSDSASQSSGEQQ